MPTASGFVLYGKRLRGVSEPIGMVDSMSTPFPFGPPANRPNPHSADNTGSGSDAPDASGEAATQQSSPYAPQDQTRDYGPSPTPGQQSPYGPSAGQPSAYPPAPSYAQQESVPAGKPAYNPQGPSYAQQGASPYSSPRPSYSQPSVGPSSIGQPPYGPGSGVGEKNSMTGLVALVLAAVGFVFACIPGIMIVGWILLSIALILGIVAQVQKGKKTFGIAAIVLVIVGTLTSAIIVVAIGDAVIGGTGNDAPPTISSQTDDKEEDPLPEDDTHLDDPAGEDPSGNDSDSGNPSDATGTRSDPYSIGDLIVGSEWEVVVNSVNLDANQVIAETNQFNDSPTPGHKYILVNLTVKYLGGEMESTYDGAVSLAFVTDGGQVINSWDAIVVPPEPAFGMTELYEGGKSTGNEALLIPEDEAGLLRISPGFMGDDVFVKIK